MMTFYKKLTECLVDKKKLVVVTLIGIKGSAPQILSAKMLVSENGLETGTIGGGKIEAHALQQAVGLIEHPSPEKITKMTVNLQRDIGMSCGGEVELLFEVLNHTPWNIVIFGAGHIAQALVKILLTLDCDITVCDTRKEWLAKFPVDTKLSTVLSESLTTEVKKIPRNAFILCMTQGHDTDLPILLEIYKNAIPNYYLGVIGSKAKAIKMKKELQALGVTREQLDTLHCPMGLAIGNNTPAEIAISLSAQLLEKRG